MVRIHPDPPVAYAGQADRGGRRSRRRQRESAAGAASAPGGGKGSANGAVAQLGERLLCKQEAVGSIPSSSTSKSIDCVGQCFAVCLGLSAKPNAVLFFNNSGR